ncbi:MAG: hypothetical protein Q4C59_10180 [Lachnospiraceae bacterium]|nr:hypothetical protein [Lachnospiraceae bacterium]
MIYSAIVTSCDMHGAGRGKESSRKRYRNGRMAAAGKDQKYGYKEEQYDQNQRATYELSEGTDGCDGGSAV